MTGAVCDEPIVTSIQVIVPLSASERAEVKQLHYRKPGTEDVCGYCYENWRAGGCRALRLLLFLETTEQLKSAADAQVDALTRELGELTISAKWNRDPARARSEFIVSFDEAALKVGGINVVKVQLGKLVDQVNNWIRSKNGYIG